MIISFFLKKGAAMLKMSEICILMSIFIAFVTTANMNLMAKLQRIENENVWLFGE